MMDYHEAIVNEYANKLQQAGYITIVDRQEISRAHPAGGTLLLGPGEYDWHVRFRRAGPRKRKSRKKPKTWSGRLSCRAEGMLLTLHKSLSRGYPELLDYANPTSFDRIDQVLFSLGDI